MPGPPGSLPLLRLVPLDVPVTLTREQAQRLAEAELAKAKYGGLPDWLYRLLDRVGELIGRLLLNGTPGSGGGPLVIVVAVLLVLAIAVILWRVGLPRLRRRRTDSEIELDPTRAPSSYRDSAAAAAGAGDFRTAVGDRFRALVRELETATILDPRPARTAREVASVAAVVLGDHRAALDESAGVFGDTWYGDRTADQEAYQQMCRLDDELTEAARHVDLSDAGDGAEQLVASGRGGGRR